MTLLCADRVWDGIDDRPLDHGFVAIDGDVISAVGRQAHLGSRYASHERIDLGDATILPGLINGHVHLTLSGSPTPVDDFLREEAAGEATLTLRAAGNLEAAAAVGVTTVRDLGTPNNVAFTVRAAAAAGQLFAPRVITSGYPITTTGGHCHWFSYHCDTEVEIRTAVRTQVCQGADVVKIFATGGNLTPRTNPFAPQYSEAELRTCVEEATRLGVPVAAHAHSPDGIRRAVAAGVSTVEHCTFETPDAVDYDAAVAERMAALGIAFCPTAGASLFRALALPAEQRSPIIERIRPKLDAVRTCVRNLRCAGVPMLAGSDAGIPNRPFSDYPADVGVLASEGFGMSACDALKAATSVAATILGLRDTGSLVPGNRADLLAVDGDPTTHIEDLTRTRLVVIGGRAWCRSRLDLGVGGRHIRMDANTGCPRR